MQTGRLRFAVGCAAVSVLLGSWACGSSIDVFGGADTEDAGQPTGAGGDTTASTTGTAPSTTTTAQGPTSSSAVTASSTGSGNPCMPVPDQDFDGDGFSGNDGDCDDCDAALSPGAFDYSGDGMDQDCSGSNDDEPVECDGALDLASADPLDGARAIGLCRPVKRSSWGVVQAAYVTSDGSPLAAVDPQGLGHGILTGMGPSIHPQEGKKLFAVSSGTARQPTDPGFQDHGGYNKGYTSGAPPGFPQDSLSCPNVTSGAPYDSAGLSVTIKTPTNAKSLSFDFVFFAYDFPQYICSQYTDAFVTILNPAAPGSVNGNIALDPSGDVMSVNGANYLMCLPNTVAGGKTFACPLGTRPLVGTGYEDHGASGWVQAHAPFAPGSTVTLLFTIWDAGDGVLDATTVIDNMVFYPNDMAVGTTTIAAPK